MIETECKLVFSINKGQYDLMFRFFYGSHIKKNDYYNPKEE
jgi:hypothetical protein